ncbi:hypothetical protein HBI75_079000 [Parastagonospora nodorum]|nr:hypothetical protein HBI75_079000 [Parastagonospora nodorum]KAH5510376.1 hypothetical protein HBI29_112540 [Parastagonospora nodorum]KAH5677330.1 hypothetical protein HBI21_101770 [Parastagonospora nodorum]
MSATTPPMKTVRFALDDDEPRTPTPTPKKTVRFALENDVVVEAPTSSLDGAVEASTATLNADPTLSTASQTSSRVQTTSPHAARSPLSKYARGRRKCHRAYL